MAALHEAPWLVSPANLPWVVSRRRCPIQGAGKCCRHMITGNTSAEGLAGPPELLKIEASRQCYIIGNVVRCAAVQ